MTGRKNAVLAGRASAALVAALRARGIQRKWVLMPANICYIVAWAVLQSGNLPALVDVDPLTGNISPETLDKFAAESPAALVICHMYGLGAPIAALAEWANRRGVFVIEDAALALGATVDGRPAGAWGDMSLFSFGEGKIVDAGNGGAFLCDDAELTRKVTLELDALPPWSRHTGQLRDQWTELYWLLHQYEAENPALASIYPMLFRIYGELTAYQLPAADWDPLASVLSSLDSNLGHRLAMSALYDEYLRFTQVRTLPRPGGSVIWRYPLLVAAKDRDALLQHLWDNDIHASRWYPSLGPMLSALAPTNEMLPLPGADRLGAEIINLPVDHTVDADAVKQTAEAIQAYYYQNSFHHKGTKKS